MDYPDLCKCEMYYARMEVKETSKTESAVARIVLSEENLEIYVRNNWRISAFPLFFKEKRLRSDYLARGCV